MARLCVVETYGGVWKMTGSPAKGLVMFVVPLTLLLLDQVLVLLPLMRVETFVQVALFEDAMVGVFLLGGGWFLVVVVF
jgi:hypothetical protein